LILINNVRRLFYFDIFHQACLCHSLFCKQQSHQGLIIHNNQKNIRELKQLPSKKFRSLSTKTSLPYYYSVKKINKTTKKEKPFYKIKKFDGLKNRQKKIWAKSPFSVRT